MGLVFNKLRNMRHEKHLKSIIFHRESGNNITSSIKWTREIKNTKRKNLLFQIGIQRNVINYKMNTKNIFCIERKNVNHIIKKKELPPEKEAPKWSFETKNGENSNEWRPRIREGIWQSPYFIKLQKNENDKKGHPSTGSSSWNN